MRSILAAIILMATFSIDAKTETAPDNCDPLKNISVQNWQNWTQVTTKPVVSQGHSNNWVAVFVNDTAKNTYLSSGASFPVCAKIVKPIYENVQGLSIRKLTVMIKMLKGYDPQNGDWWYATYDKSGTYIREQGKLPGCITCHKQAIETDYLFSREVLDAVGK